MGQRTTQRFKQNESETSSIINRLYSPIFKDLINNILSKKGALIVFGGRPGIGKTAFMLSIIKESPTTSFYVFSLELSKHQLIDRFREMTGEKKLTEGKSFNYIQIHDYCTISDDSTYNIDFTTLASIVVNAHNASPIDIVFLDYFQLVNKEDSKFAEKLKNLAANLNITIVLLSQMRKDVPLDILMKPKLNSFPINVPDFQYIDEIYYMVKNRYLNNEDELFHNYLSSNSEDEYLFVHTIKGYDTNQNRIMIFKFNRDTSSIEGGLF